MLLAAGLSHLLSLDEARSTGGWKSVLRVGGLLFLVARPPCTTTPAPTLGTTLLSLGASSCSGCRLLVLGLVSTAVGFAIDVVASGVRA